MTARLFLHIGTEKTGTTSVQQYFRENRRGLLADGILYPRSFGEPGHKALVGAALPYEKCKDLGPRVEPTRLAAKLAAQIASSKPRTVILSCEQLSSRMGARHIDVLADLLGGLNVRPTVVLYLRRQDELLTSSYSTAVKGRRSKALVPRVAVRHRRRYHYLRLVRRWAARFPDPVVRVLEPNQLPSTDVLADFCQVIDHKLPAAPPGRSVRHNQSLAPDLLEFKRRANARIWQRASSYRQAARASQALLSRLESIPSPYAGYSLLTVPQRACILAAYESSNRILARRFLGRDGPLFDARCDQSAPVYDPTVEDDMVRIWRELERRRSIVDVLGTLLRGPPLWA